VQRVASCESQARFVRARVFLAARSHSIPCVCVPLFSKNLLPHHTNPLLTARAGEGAAAEATPLFFSVSDEKDACANDDKAFVCDQKRKGSVCWLYVFKSNDFCIYKAGGLWKSNTHIEGSLLWV
jgi:hypothetical protein